MIYNFETCDHIWTGDHISSHRKISTYEIHMDISLVVESVIPCKGCHMLRINFACDHV